ncbi:MAG: hypothetical protein HY319_16715 [Armatimonadetes bacterium]|nr:hypothetical protein [Armatimonadota bacterium]
MTHRLIHYLNRQRQIPEAWVDHRLAQANLPVGEAEVHAVDYFQAGGQSPGDGAR